MTTTEITPRTGLPIGPGSLTWRLFGDRRTMLFLSRTGTLQNMHPAVGAALQDHSNVFENPWDRLLRSVPPIAGVIYDPAEADTGGVVRNFHTNIKGTDHHGHRYHALNPDVFWWTHVTFVETCMAVQEHFGTPLTDAEKAQLLGESITWWSRYGLSMSPAFGTYDEFQTYWDQMLDTVLEANATTDYAVTAHTKRIPPPPHVPGLLWRWVLERPAMFLNLWLMTALLPERARITLGLRWRRRDAIAFAAFAGLVRLVWPVLPERARYVPRASVNMRAARRDPERWAAATS